MVKIIESLILVAPGVCVILWPRTLWWFSWRWWVPDREPTRVELLVARVVGVILVLTGLALAQLYVW